MVDKEITETARLLYSRCKEAFDFVFECRPDPDDVLEPFHEILKNGQFFTEDRPAPRLLRFIPSEWIQIKELNSCPRDRWTKTGRNLLFELRTHRSSDRVDVKLVLGPSENAFREHIYIWAIKNPGIFIGATKPMRLRTTTIYTYDLLSAGAGENMEEGEKMKAVQSAWRDFTDGHLSLLKESIGQSLRAWADKDK